MVQENYNGWTNYPTWAMYLWLTNDYNDYTTVRYLMLESEDVFEFASELEDRFGDYKDYHNVGVCADLLSWTFEQINWQEIAYAEWDEDAWNDYNADPEDDENEDKKL